MGDQAGDIEFDWYVKTCLRLAFWTANAIELLQKEYILQIFVALFWIYV